MPLLADIDWRGMFIPSGSLSELVLRGTLIYLSIFTMFRILRREAGAVGVTDVLVVVLIADASQNAMAGEYRSITEGLVLIGTIVFWDVFLDWLGYQFPAVRPLLVPPPRLLIQDGRFLRRNMRRELISQDELMAKLREHGIDQVDQVRRCYEEADGEISVIRRDQGDSAGNARNPALR